MSGPNDNAAPVTMADFDYRLPESAIAQTPAEPRESARMLVSLDEHSPTQHSVVSALPVFLRSGDVLVVNETRVLPARIAIRRSTGGGGEVLLLEPIGDGWWNALVRPSAKIRAGTIVASERGDLAIEVGEDAGEGRRRVRLQYGSATESAALAEAGTMPLPPYIHERLVDQSRYQTVYANQPGSAAAPTAGLHLSAGLLEQITTAGVELLKVELVVGLDTFRPVTVESPQDHLIHSERYAVPAGVIEACHRARAAGGRVIAVGTTSVRALESAAATGQLEGRTSLFIHGAYDFALVDVMLTNFHLPRSSLLLLVEAFVGPRWRNLYREALKNGYRFLSFGDCMLIGRRPS